MIDGKLTIRVDASIFDPVCGLMIDWRTYVNIATVKHLIPSPQVQGRWRPDYPAAPYTKVENKIETKVTPLGTKQVFGLEVFGISYSTFLPAGSPRKNAQPVHVLIERWDSPDLNIMVEHLMDDPLASAGRTHMQLIYLDRSEPDPSLFRIPEGYRVEDRWAPATLDGPEVVPGWLQ
jgi:hypothetical protein